MNSPVTLRVFQPEDTLVLLELFYDTVHAINANDYSPEQQDAWIASKTENVEHWQERFLISQTIVAWDEQAIVGFGNLEHSGKAIGMVYVHKDHQHRRIGSMILKHLEEILTQSGTSVARAGVSITARPFFTRNGYSYRKDNIRVRKGVELLNFIMEKELNAKQSG